MGGSINALSSGVQTVVENSGGLSIIEIVERGPQGIPGDSTLAAVSTWKADSEYSLNQKVSYLDAIYNADVDIVPVGTLPTDETYWSNISGTLTEVDYTQTVLVGGSWSVTNVGDTLAEFNEPTIQIWYNGIKLRKGTQVTWVSSTEVSIIYNATELTDYLTIRNSYI